MEFLLPILFAGVAAIAAAFAALPLLRPARESDISRPRPWLAATLALTVAGLGLGAYYALGQPQLALRSLTGPRADDFRALVATLAARMRQVPDDKEGWALLGRAYLALDQPAQAAAALRRAVQLGGARGSVPASLYSLYGEALSQAAGGAVPAEAEEAFRAALARDAKEPAARYYLGLAARARGQKDQALAMWEPLLAEAPADAPWRPALVDAVAALRAEQLREGGGNVPDIAAMVRGLAARLEARPNDLGGWMRLIRAYAVLGEAGKAKASLARARGHFGRDETAQRSLTALARDLALEGG